MRKILFLCVLFASVLPLLKAQVTIGTTDYGSDLQGAINATADNDIITISGNLNVAGNVDLGGGSSTFTLRGTTNAKIIFSSGARLIFEQAKIRTIKTITMDGDSTGDRGGIIKMGSLADLTLDSTVITGGRSASHGGAIAIGGAKLTAKNSVFSDNRAKLSGGAIFTDGNGKVSLINCKFTNNWCAAFTDGADGKGAAIAIIGCSDPGLYAERCLFSQNNSRNHGGVFIFENAKGTLVNCTFTENKCLNAGGVAFLWQPVTLKFVNCTFAYNKAVGNTNSPCIKNIQSENTLEFDNCIIYENRDENGSGNDLGIQSDVADNITINNSVISEISSNLTIQGSNNILRKDIVNLGLAPAVNPDGVLTIAKGSQAVDLGNGAYLSGLSVTTDQLGKTRNFAGNKVDAGAYELNGSSGSGYVTLNGTSYGTDFGGAIIAAANGDTVKVFGIIDITSSKAIDAGGSNIVIQGYNGATFRFTSTGAEGAGSRFTWATNTVAGYTRKFKDIDMIGDPKGTSDYGGIITMTKTGNLILENVSMSKGWATAKDGGALRITGAGAVLTAVNCLFIDNKAYRSGGAIMCANTAQAVIKNSRFIGNQAAFMLTDGKAGAIAVNGCPTTGLYAENCSFIGNKSQNNGGVFLFENSKATVINSTMYNDSCKKQGAIAFIWQTSNVTFVNNTIAYNGTYASAGDGACIKNNQAVNTISIRNCYFYQNKSKTDGIYQDITCGEANSNVTVNGSILQGGFNANTLTGSGVNIIGSDLTNPGIAESVNGDYMLPIDSTSMAINFGDTLGISNLIKVDQRYQPRNFKFGRVDAGAYEMQGVLGIPPEPWPSTSGFVSYEGLSMSGYQGWFSAAGDGSGQNWVHYAKDGSFTPGSCVIDFWPDMREASASEKFATPFRKGNDTAFVYSPYKAATVNRHFNWMKQYGIDGVFMQRFVVDIMNPTTKARLNQVLKNAIQAAKANHRAISIMYDLSGIDTTTKTRQQYLDIIKADWSELKNTIGIAKYGDDVSGKNQPLLYHKSKANQGNPYPLVSIWGVGFNDGRKYDIDFCSKVVDYFQNDNLAGRCAIMLGVPTYWRTGGSDVVTGTEYTKLQALISKVDIIMPWHTGRFNRTSFNDDVYKNLVAGDVAYCTANSMDYVPVLSPGFSWRNLKGDASLTGKPREGGLYYWDMARAAISGGAKMLYTGMFDEVNEGTQIFKVDNNPPSATIPFLTYSPDPEDHYLWLSGEVRRGLKSETTMGTTLPARSKADAFQSTFSFTRSNDVKGRTILALKQAATDHKIYYADPYSVPDGAPTLNIARDTSLFRKELTSGNDTINLASFDQYLRIVEVDAADKVIACQAVLLDTSLLGSVANFTGFTNQQVKFRPGISQTGQTMITGNPANGHSYWAAPVQSSADFTAPYYRTSRDTNVWKTSMSVLTTGIEAREGDFIPVVEVNANGEILGFNVFKISKDLISRLITSSDTLKSSLTYELTPASVTINLTIPDGYKLYRTDPLTMEPAAPIYLAPYDNYSNVFKILAKAEEIQYVSGQKLTYIEVKDGEIVGYRKIDLSIRQPLEAKVNALPDLNKGEHTVFALAEPAKTGHKVYIYPEANPKDEPPRTGQDYTELSPVYSKEVTSSGISLSAKAGDFYYLIETDAANALVGFSQITLAAENISVFANPAIHKMQSVYSISPIGKTQAGKIDITVTPASGYTVYRTEVPAAERIPVYKSKSANNPEFTAVSGNVSLNAAKDNNIILVEYNAAGELSGIAINEARDSALLVYYVDENGNDSNEGSKYLPFKTLEKALGKISKVVSIDSAATIYVSGNIQLQTPTTAGEGTTISKSVKMIGSNGATLKAAAGNRVLELRDAKFYFENITLTGGFTPTTNGGAGIYLRGNSYTYAEFKNCSISGNELSDAGGVYGGGIRIVGASAKFTSCIIEGNKGRNRGGGIAIAHGSSYPAADYTVTFDGCYIANNVSKFLGTVEGHGGGFFITNSETGTLTVKIINSTIQGNEAKSAGGAMFVEGSALNKTKIKIINSAITDNRGQNAGNGHGIRIVGGSDNTLEIYNSLLWDNIGGTDGTTVDIRNDAGTVITCQQSYVKTPSDETKAKLTGVYKTGDQPDLNVLKAALPAGYANSLFINNSKSFAVNYGTPSFLTAEGIDYDATFAKRNATDGFIDAGPTEYNSVKFDKGPIVDNPIPDKYVAKNANQMLISLTEVFTDPDKDPISYSLTGNNNPGVVKTDFDENNNLVLTFLTDKEGDAKIKVRGTANGKYAEDEFIVHVGYAPVVENPVENIIIPNLNGGSFTVDMTNVFSDPDDNAANIEIAVMNNSKTSLVTSASFTGKVLNYTVQPGEQGTAIVTVKAKSGIRTALTTVSISIGKPPVVANPIPSVTVKVNSVPVTRYLANTFTDPDDPADQIVKSIYSNSNSGLVNAAIEGNTLTLTFTPGQTGTSVITVKALSAGLSVTTSFNVVVTATDQLIVLNPLPPVKVGKNAPDSVIDLSNVFYNMADPNAQIQITVKSNSNPTLLSASVNGKALTLDFAADQEGTAEIVLQGTAGGTSINHSFQVGVGGVDLVFVKNKPNDLQIGKNPGIETKILLSSVFGVVGKANANIAVDYTYTNPTLVNAYINSSNELVISAMNANVANGSSEFILTGSYNGNSVSTSFKVTILETGVNSIKKEAVRLYPVPVQDVLNIAFDDNENFERNIQRIEILSLTGKVVKVFSENTNNNVVELNVSDLDRGTYMIRIITKNGDLIKLFVK